MSFILSILGSFAAEAAVIGSALELVAEADGALVATSFIGTWAQPTTPEP